MKELMRPTNGSACLHWRSRIRKYIKEVDSVASGSPSSNASFMPERRLVLHTPNPLDLSVPDLNDLAAQLSCALEDSGNREVQVSVDSYEPRGAGNHFIDQLYVILPHAEFMKDTIFATVVASVTGFMRNRFKRKHEHKRPRKVYFFTPDGRLAGVFVLEDASSEVRWLDPVDDGES
jgi:hypothetical protein